MRDIYSAACHTVVWLGEATEESSRALDPNFLRSINDILVAYEPNNDSWTIGYMEFSYKVDEYLSSSPSVMESLKGF
jgi:hypothetical protein